MDVSSSGDHGCGLVALGVVVAELFGFLSNMAIAGHHRASLEFGATFDPGLPPASMDATTRPGHAMVAGTDCAARQRIHDAAFPLLWFGLRREAETGVWCKRQAAI